MKNKIYTDEIGNRDQRNASVAGGAYIGANQGWPISGRVVRGSRLSVFRGRKSAKAYEAAMALKNKGL